MSVLTPAAPPAVSGRSHGLVVCDIGDVLVEVDSAACPEYLASAVGLDPGDVAKLLHESAIYGRFDAGELNSDALVPALRTLLDAPGLTSEQVDAAWRSSIKEACPVLAPVAARLAAAGRLVYASNNNPIHFPVVRARLSDAGIQPEVPALLSHQIGVRKPDAEFYRLLKELLPGPCAVFIDDRPENVAAAEQAGLPAWLHADPHATVKMLDRLGLLSQDTDRDGGCR